MRTISLSNQALLNKGTHICLFMALVLALTACSESGTKTEMTGTQQGSLNYNWDVKPILSDNCFACHGNDPEGLEAGLRLNDRESVTSELPESPGKFAIVAGEPENSELFHRISSDDIDVRMPPKDTNKTLNEHEIAILERWIVEGAEYEDHWAFESPVKPVVPESEFNEQSVNEIDAFVYSRLQEEGLSPTGEADKEKLINRVSLTLTGLPPSIEEIDAFLADDSPDAYEKLVDQLLASEKYAEHMTSYWMDLARWSESDGYLDDHHDRTLWPWRDWVLHAFDENMPFDQFGTWQLAGDMFPNATEEQILATAYLRVGKRTTENGAIEEEYIIENNIEKTDNALGTAFMGLTVGCARCHDHRYDPITQEDYYSLTAFFNSSDEPGVYPPGFSGIQGGPTLAWPNNQEKVRLQELESNLEEKRNDYERARTIAADEVGTKLTMLLNSTPQQLALQLADSLAQAQVAHYPLDSATPANLEDLPPPRPDRLPPERISELRGLDYDELRESGQKLIQTGPDEEELGQEELQARVPRNYVAEEMTLSPSGQDGVPAAVIQDPQFRDGVEGQALFFNERNKGYLGMNVGWYDRTEPFSFDFWFYANEAYEDVPIINHRNEQNAGTTGWSLSMVDGHLWLQLAHSPPANMIALESVFPFPVQKWTKVTVTYDGSSQAVGTRIYLDGEEVETRVDHDKLTRTMLPWNAGDVFESFVGVAFGTRFREKAPVGSGMDEIRFFDKALNPTEVAYLHDKNAVLESDLGRWESELRDWLVAQDEYVVTSYEALTEARKAHNQLVSVIPQVLVMGERPEPRQTYVLNRGVYSAPTEPVEPKGLESVFEWEETLPRNRIGLSQWLFDEENPLTARVFVNRVWQMHFGIGIVETAQDFGFQAATPTHPFLLDYLAVDFIESGWDIKALHKKIVTSATYKQSSVASDELLARDPQNKLLARGPSWRMNAEMIRDQVLFVSGLLVDEIGGESVKPYQPDGIWNPSNSFYRYPEPESIPAKNHHRRTLYSFIKRNAMHPSLSIFDFTNRTESRATRSRSNTPLQALDLMNDPQYVEAYRALAGKVLEEKEGLDGQLTRLYRLATRMSPSERQLDVLKEFYQSQHEKYSADGEKAGRLIATGVTEPSVAVDNAILAAMTNVAALVMNSPDAYTVQ